MKPNDRGDRHLKHEQPTPLNKIEAVVVPLIYFGDFCKADSTDERNTF